MSASAHRRAVQGLQHRPGRLPNGKSPIETLNLRGGLARNRHALLLPAHPLTHNAHEAGPQDLRADVSANVSPDMR
jgi:hypothetical protein